MIYDTKRSMPRTIPGHIYTPEGSGRETESFTVPHIPQVMTLTFGGVSPLAAGDYVVPFVTPYFGTIEIKVTSDGTKTFAAATTELAGLIAADGNLGNLVGVTNNGTTTVTLTSRSAGTSLPLPEVTVPGADTLTPAVSQAASSPSLQLGLFYVFGTTTAVTPVTGGPRGARIAKLPTAATTLAQVRGVVGRTANQTWPTSNLIADAGIADAYRAGQIGYGCLRGEVCVVVDPASATMSEDPGSEVHLVIAAGTYSVIGSVAAAADGANTIRLDNTEPRRARVTAREETIAFGSNTGRCVVLRVNQTN